MNEEVYIPPNAKTLESYHCQLRLGIQGMPKSGKTYGATTFKNPIFLSFDRGLISHSGRKDIVDIPFYDGDFVDSIKKRDGLKLPPDQKEAFPIYLKTEAQKFTSSQTLIIDALTGLQSAYHIWYNNVGKDMAISQKGGENKYIQWRLKLDYLTEIMMHLKSLKCDVILISHESPERNDDGNLTGFNRPLLTGQFQDELVSHFTDWFRAVAFPKPAATVEAMAKFKEHFKITDAIAKEWIESTPPNVQSMYLWQTQSDNIAACGTSLIGAPKYIPQGYKYFEQYRNKPK